MRIVLAIALAIAAYPVFPAELTPQKSVYGCLPGVSSNDPVDSRTAGYMDLIGMESTLVGTQLTVTFTFRDLPEVLLFNRLFTPNNQIEYVWAAYIDTNGTGGAEFEISAKHFKQPGAATIQRPIDNDVQVSVWKREPSGAWGLVGDATIMVDTVNDTMRLQGEVADITPTSRIFYQMIEYNATFDEGDACRTDPMPCPVVAPSGTLDIQFNSSASGCSKGSSTPCSAGQAITFDATASRYWLQSCDQVDWSFGDGTQGTGKSVEKTYAAVGSYPVTMTIRNSMGSKSSTATTVTIGAACPPGRLCFAGGDFSASLTAKDPRTGATGDGLPIPQSDIFGYFAIPALTGDAGNPEVFVKMLDGGPVNGKQWVFYGGLTDFEYTLTVTDLNSGAVKTYTKPGFEFCGGADTSAFAAVPSSDHVAEATTAPTESTAPSGLGSEAAGPCNSTEICLLGGKFALSLSAKDPRSGMTAPGLPIPQSDKFGYFSIPGLTGNPGNPEMFVKVLDGRILNGKYWVFYGGLTDLETTIVVRDTETGVEKSYGKSGGSFCGGADTNAF